ncbi:MAG: hypothetical protein FWB95_02780 [Treponema sp.]|nr:hypothetical protein [Treponema sp.]
MTRENILQKSLEMAKHNLYCYSADYLSSRPKAGYEKEYAQTKEEINVLESWLKEIQNKNDSSDLIKFNIVIWFVDEDGEGEAEIGYLNAVSEYHAAALLRERVRNGRYPKDAWLDYVKNGKKISIDINGRKI